MKALQTVRLKPNPAGKDRSRQGASETQLGAEWADIKNVGIYPVELDGVSLYHIAYSADGRSSKWELVISLKGVLPVGNILRVHTGKGPIGVLRQEDVNGAHFHCFSGHDQYVWNNDRGDCASLWVRGASEYFDRACYDEKPPEGVVLERVGDKLLAAVRR